MSKAIERSELSQRIESVKDDVVREHVPDIVSHNGVPEAAVIPHTDVRRWQQFAEHGVLDRCRRLLQRTDALTAGYSDEEIAADVAAASADVRATG
jgi:hypothetical protein